MIALAWSCAVVPVASAAQYSEPATIEEIQVTATRRPTELRKVSAALSIITSDETRDVKSRTDALAAQTGVYLQQTTPGQGAAIIRGLIRSELVISRFCKSYLPSLQN